MRVWLSATCGPFNVTASGGVGDPSSDSVDLEITNNADQQLTLRRIELRSTSGGFYQLPNRSAQFTLVIPPHSSEVAKFTMWGNATGSMRTHVSEPTTLRGVAYFDSAAGPMQKGFTTTIDLAGQ